MTIEELMEAVERSNMEPEVKDGLKRFLTHYKRLLMLLNNFKGNPR